MELSHFPSLDSNYDIWLEHSSKKIGYKLAHDESGNPKILESVAPFNAPQIFQGGYSYDSVNANVNVPVPFDSWQGGCGFAAIPGAEPLARSVYALSSGIDASWTDGLMLSPAKQTGGSTTQAPIKFVYSSFGIHVMTTRYVMEWTGAAWTTRLDNTNKTNTDLAEYKNSRGTYLVLTLSDDHYYISTDGITFTQPNSGALYPTYRSHNVSSTTTIPSAVITTITKPSGTAENDFLVAGIVTTAGTVTAPSGWTSIQNRTIETHDVYYYWKRATSAEPTTYSWSVSGGSAVSGVIACYQGVQTTGTPYAVTGGNAFGVVSSYNTTAFTSLLDDTTHLVMILGGVTTGSNITNTVPAGYTERVDENPDDGATAEQLLFVFDKTNIDPGAVSIATSTFSGNVTNVYGLELQLYPTTGASSLNNGMRMAIRGSADGEPLLWCVDSNGGIRNTPDPTHPGLWSNPDTIQFSQPVTISGLEVVDNVFYLFHSKGIDSYDGTTVSTVWNNTTLTLESDAARPYTWVDQNVYFTYNAALFQYNSSTNVVSKVWPVGKQLSVPTRTGTITAITGDSKNLYFSVKNLDGDYIIFKCDPYNRFTMSSVEYMPVFDIINHSTTSTAAMIVVPPASDTFHTTRPQLVVGYGTSGDYYILPTYGGSPYGDSSYKFDSSGAKALYGTYVDAGASLFSKFLNTISANRVDVDGTYSIAVNAQANKTDGTSSTQSHSNNTLGVTTTNITTDTEFTSIRPYITMRTSSSSDTPLLANYVFNCSLNPPRMRQWDIYVEIAEDLERIGGGDSSYGAHYITDHLFNGLTERVTYYDRGGTSYVTRILDVKGVHVGRNKIVYNISLVQLL